MLSPIRAGSLTGTVGVLTANRRALALMGIEFRMQNPGLTKCSMRNPLPATPSDHIWPLVEGQHGGYTAKS
jgi:hypothetical protein